MPPIRTDRQAGRQNRQRVPLRCWADTKSVLTTKLATECQAPADPDSPLGLCKRHQQEIVEGVDGGS